ncbi:MAG TPA: bifunctional alpha,alpha-trehalose-phosphate synthase (UDP-forming)/trehalose-phosphatase, partial [Bacteroidota bacterium]
ILNALLTADLVGFHTHEYAQAFLGCVRRLLGFENTLGELMVGPRNVQVDVFPIGIDFDSFARASAAPENRNAVENLKGAAGKLIFSVCRLDYTKGIPQSLAGVEMFLRDHPEWCGKFEYTLVVVPSRERVERYGSLKREIDELIGRINSTHGTLEWTPVRYVYRSLSFQELVALYAAADVALILPLRDGMNLVAKEYLASRQDEQGVLVLSEMTGAAKELLEALIVNPNSTHEVASALLEALTMPADEQIRRNSVMRRRLTTYNVHWWVNRFIDRLRDVAGRAQRLTVKLLEGEAREAMLKEFRETPQHLLMLDYDGTLVPFASTPGGAKPDAPLREQLRTLASAPGNSVVVLSSRDRRTLQEWLGDLPLTLAAEHGAWMRTPGSADWTATITQSQDFWKSQIRPTLDLIAERIPGSFVEEKDFALVWHYRRADPESGWSAARELLDTLTNIAANLGIQVLPANKAIEIKTMEMNKGIFYTRYLTPLVPRFILAAGDDWKDEALFSVLPASAYSIRIGMNASHARFNLTGVRDMRALLAALAGEVPLTAVSR